MSVKELKEIQDKLDKMKYEASSFYGKDQCGEYAYCKHCNKKNKYPCASAFKKFAKEGK